MLKRGWERDGGKEEELKERRKEWGLFKLLDKQQTFINNQFCERCGDLVVQKPDIYQWFPTFFFRRKWDH